MASARLLPIEHRRYAGCVVPTGPNGSASRVDNAAPTKVRPPRLVSAFRPSSHPQVCHTPVVDQELNVDGHRFGVSQVPGGIDVTLLTGPSAGMGFTMGGANPHPARTRDCCRRFLSSLDESTGRVEYGPPL